MSYSVFSTYSYTLNSFHYHPLHQPHPFPSKFEVPSSFFIPLHNESRLYCPVHLGNGVIHLSSRTGIVVIESWSPEETLFRDRRQLSKQNTHHASCECLSSSSQHSHSKLGVSTLRRQTGGVLGFSGQPVRPLQ